MREVRKSEARRQKKGRRETKEKNEKTQWKIRKDEDWGGRR